jgi:hypothetical protein
MNPAPKDAGLELIACGLLLAVLGGLLHRSDPTMDYRLLVVALAGGGMCLAAGLLALWRPVNPRWCAALLLVLAAALGWRVWHAWEAHLLRGEGFRPVPVVTSVLCLAVLTLGGILWSGARDPK